MRECNKTILPMVSSVVAMLTNLVLNFVLIFGHFGAPALGAKGAAVATVISRFVELSILVIWSACHKNDYNFFRGLYRSCYIPLKLFGRIMAKGMPLMVNEFMWSTGMAVLNQSYSTCGLAVVPAVNICETFNNVASVGVIALGHTVGILMGQMMGAGCSREEIKDSNNKIIRIGLVIGVVFGGMMALGAPLFPQLYQADADIRSLASQLMLVLAIMKPVMAFLYCTYFSIRAGGKTWTTFFFDCGILWCLTVPLSIVLSRMTDIPILLLFISCQLVDIAKCFIGYYLLKKGTWIQNLAK
jgi:Na+-driven multidrug efflux pump